MASSLLLEVPADISARTLPGYLAGVRMFVLDTPAGSDARKTAIEAATRKLGYAAFICRKNKNLVAKLADAAAKVAQLQETVSE